MTPVTPLTDEPQFGGCVELIPERPLLMEFVGKKQTWGFPIALLEHFALACNPEYDGKDATPPDQLTLAYATAVVTLIGWRLDKMLGPLGSGCVARVRTATAALAGLTVEEPWVTEIWISEFGIPVSEEPAKPSTIEPKV